MNIKEFEKLNKEREKNGEKTFANPKNSTAGKLKITRSQKCCTATVEYILYIVSSVQR